jgi:hypothetical protein
MNVDRIVHSFAGALIVASLALGHWVSPWWFLLTLFVGLNLLQSGLTDWCLMSRILAKAGVPNDRSCGL